MVAAILIAGIWGIWKALVQRRYTETAGALAISVVFVLIALFFVYQPERTIGAGQPRGPTRSRWRSSPAPTAARSTIPSRPSARSPTTCSRRWSYRPWVVLEFGGLTHCVDTDHLDADGFPRPVSPHDPTRDVCRDHLKPARTATAATPRASCASRPARTNARPNTTRCARASAPHRSVQFAGYRRRQGRRARGRHPTGRRRLPAPDVLGRSCFLGALGAVALLGFLSLAVILAQVVALVLLGFAPVALVIGDLPRRRPRRSSAAGWPSSRPRSSSRRSTRS